MLKARIIPCLDLRHGRVVKGRKFSNVSDVDNPETLAKFYAQGGADELVFYDINASQESRSMCRAFICKIARLISIPFTVGGGVSSVSDFADILKRGADKVSINSAAIKNPGLIKKAAAEFGSAAVVLSVDVKRVKEGQWEVVSGGGRVETGLDAVKWAVEGVRLGAGELIINSLDGDGMKNGYDLELLRAVNSEVDVPVIASGGAGKMEHFLQAATEGKANGLLAASVFHYQEIDILALKRYLRSKGIRVKLS